MTDDEGAARAKLPDEFRELEEEYDGHGEFPEEVDARRGALEIAMEKIGRAGGFVTLDRHGELAVCRGLVQPEDEPREDADVHGGLPAAHGQGVELLTDSHADGIGYRLAIASAGQALGANMADDEDDGALKLLPERLVMELKPHRTLALREAVGRSPDVALKLLLLKLVNDTFRTSSSAGNCLEASVRHV